MEIEYNGNSYYIEKADFESQYQFEKRAWFIVKCHSNSQNKYSLDKLIILSKIYSNIEYQKCSYNSDITKKISLLKKSF